MAITTARPSPAGAWAIARMVGHITYLSEKSMHQKFGRDLQDKSSLDYDFVTEFKVESYLNYRGDEFVKRFDANSYLYITKAMDYFDLAQPSGDLKRTLSVAKAAFLVISVSSDWLFPPYMSREIVSALRRNNLDVSYAELQSDYGHDAFLLEVDAMTRLIESFLEYGQPSHAKSIGSLVDTTYPMTDKIRPEFRYIVDMVEPDSKVLDLGCGEGHLLKLLQREKRARVQGIELSDTAIQECVVNGLFVYHGDLDEGLADFNDQSVDYVILTSTIQVLQQTGLPDRGSRACRQAMHYLDPELRILANQVPACLTRNNAAHQEPAL